MKRFLVVVLCVSCVMSGCGKKPETDIVTGGLDALDNAADVDEALDMVDGSGVSDLLDEVQDVTEEYLDEGFEDEDEALQSVSISADKVNASTTIYGEKNSFGDPIESFCYAPIGSNERGETYISLLVPYDTSLDASWYDDNNSLVYTSSSSELHFDTLLESVAEDSGVPVSCFDDLRVETEVGEFYIFTSIDGDSFNLHKLEGAVDTTVAGMEAWYIMYPEDTPKDWNYRLEMKVSDDINICMLYTGDLVYKMGADAFSEELFKCLK